MAGFFFAVFEILLRINAGIYQISPRRTVQTRFLVDQRRAKWIAYHYTHEKLSEDT